MPYMRLDTNLNINKNTLSELITKTSSIISTFLGKPESYVLIHVNSDQSMIFAGSQEPLAYIELKSIELPKNQTEPLSSLLCDFVAEELNIPANRIYIEFTNIDRSMWGWNNKTFE